MNSNKKLTRSSRDRKIAGVCGGLAEFSGIDATVIRILFVILALAGGPGLLVYLALWLILPKGY
jgi:phage shock protein C